MTTAGDHPDSPEETPLLRALVRADSLIKGLAAGSGDVRAVLAEFEGLAAMVGTEEPYATAIRLFQATARLGLARETGDRAGLTRAWQAIAAMARLVDDVHPAAGIVEQIFAAQTAVEQRNPDEAQAAITHLSHLRDTLPLDSNVSAGMVDDVISWITHAGGLDVTEDAERTLGRLRAAAAAPEASNLARATRLAALGTMELRYDDNDEAIDHLREAVALAAPSSRPGLGFQATLGAALLQRSGPGDLAESTSVLEQARDRAGGPGHPIWPLITLQLGEAYRLDRRRELGNATGLSALAGHLRGVLLQSGTAAATVAARYAAVDAIQVACWHLADSDAAGAALALDAGRGLMLQSATRFGDVPARLEASGEPAIAERWRAAGGADTAPLDLRAEVLAALEGEEAALDPPAHDEVRPALRTLGLDAVAYLVCADGPIKRRAHGAVVVVPLRGRPSWIPLRRLTNQAPPLRRYLAADAALGAGTRDLSSAVEPPDDWRESLDDVCEWAWSAAIKWLLAVLPKLRVPRVALIPMGELARVPWHAARDRRGTYAVQRAVISYAVSARSLCDVAAAAPVAVMSGGLVVGDPDTMQGAADLLAARAEAAAVRDVFYPQARYVGRNPDGSPAAAGRGTVAEVRRWLAEADEAGSVLHAACHAVATSGNDSTDTAHLVLADGAKLTAEDLMRALGARRGTGLALAVLAGCNTGVPGSAYDEAFSLGTAFLTAGTRSVVSALWPVPDSVTSVLMFMFHFFLRTQPPLDALHAAQLWMLSRERQVPESMPSALRARIADGDPTDVASWAGFTHQGR